MLAERLQRSILKRKTTMANQSLALYAVMKGTLRLDVSEQTRSQVKTMTKLLTTNRTSRATSVTVKETSAAVRTMTAQKKAKVAQATVSDASNKAAFASVHAAIQAAANSGSPPPTLVESSPARVAPAPVASPLAAPVAAPLASAPSLPLQP